MIDRWSGAIWTSPGFAVAGDSGPCSADAGARCLVSLVDASDWGAAPDADSVLVPEPAPQPESTSAAPTAARATPYRILFMPCTTDPEIGRFDPCRLKAVTVRRPTRHGDGLLPPGGLGAGVGMFGVARFRGRPREAVASAGVVGKRHVVIVGGGIARV